MSTHLININDTVVPRDGAECYPHLMPLKLYPVGTETEPPAYQKRLVRMIRPLPTFDMLYPEAVGTRASSPQP